MTLFINSIGKLIDAHHTSSIKACVAWLRLWLAHVSSQSDHQMPVPSTPRPLFNSKLARVLQRSGTKIFARFARTFPPRAPLAAAKWLCVGLITTASLGSTGCRQADDILGQTFPAYRYRLTVEINTPEGVRRGSGVIEVQTSQAGKYNLDAQYVMSRKVRGDAVVVDLGRRGRVYVVLKDHDNQTWPSYTMVHFIEPLTNVPTQDTGRIEVERVLALHGPIALRAHIDDRRYPLDDGLPDFVTFSNPADLTTAKIVQPDQLSSVFGAGVTFRGMTVQITNDAVTRSAVHSLPWLSDDAAYLRNNKRKPDGNSANGLEQIDFTRGM